MRNSWTIDTLNDAVDYFSAPQPDLLKGLQNAEQVQKLLCDLLEHIADSIPASVDARLCIVLANQLGPIIRSIHRFEEKALFPFSSGFDLSGKTVARLKHEHLEDECFAEELTDALLELSKSTPTNPEATGYMLRGFFESVRRHAAFETEHLRPLLLTAPTSWAN